MLAPKTRGLTEFQAYISAMARNCRGIATETITDYLIGNDRRGFKHYPPPRGQKYIRKGYLRAGWMRRGQGTMSRAENTIYYAPYVQGTGTQVWWTKKYGWRSVSEIVSTNIRGATRAAEIAIVKKRK
jgi:hypothetical protein